MRQICIGVSEQSTMTLSAHRYFRSTTPVLSVILILDQVRAEETTKTFYARYSMCIQPYCCYLHIRSSLPYHSYIMSTNNTGPDPSGNEANASENALILVKMDLTIYDPSRVGEKAMYRDCTMYLI
jgi:hypothetical protein